MKRSVLADDLKRISLDRVEDVFERDLSGRAQQFIASFRTPDALNHFSLSKAVEDLLGVGKVEPLALGDLSRADRDLSVIFREVKGAENAALAPFCDSHTTYLQEIPDHRSVPYSGVYVYFLLFNGCLAGANRDLKSA